MTDQFTQKMPYEAKRPTARTAMRVLYDDAAIYFLFDCQQAGLPVVARLTRRDRPVESDSVTVTIDSRADGKSAFEFSVNAAGVQIDGTRSDDVGFSTDWDETWAAQVQVTPGGWSAEVEIPLRVLRFDSSPVQSWGLQARRYISALQETDEWAFIARDNGGEVSRYGKLEQLAALRPKGGLELRPFVLGRVRQRDPDPDLVASGLDASASAGLDLKWRASQALTLDLAINPDFGQVEADQVVLNLTTYEVFFPEKRAFFIEGADTFTTRLNLFYPRRIGRAPDLPALRTAAPFQERLFDRPDPSTIYGAAKLVGSLGDRFTVGAMSALTGNNHVDAVLADGTRDERLVDPLTSYNVLRLKRDIGGNAHVGFLGTAVIRAEPGVAADWLASSRAYPSTGVRAQQLCPSGQTVRSGARCHHDAFVAGIDAAWRSESGDYVISGQGVASAISEGPARTMPDGTVIFGGDIAPGGRLFLSKEGGKHWLADIFYEGYGRTLDYNDLGYLQRQNSHELSGYLEYRDLEPGPHALQWDVFLITDAKNNLDNLNLGRLVELGVGVKLASYWFLQADVEYRPARHDDREVGDGTALEHMETLGGQEIISTDPRRAATAKLILSEQFLAEGMSLTLEAELGWKPLSQVEIQLLPTALYAYGEPRYAGPGTADRELVFGKLFAKSVGATLRMTYTFAPTLSLQTYAQVFLASAHYSEFASVTPAPEGRRPVIDLAALTRSGAPAENPDFEEASLNVNVVLRWEYARGSTMYLVYTHAQVPRVPLGPGVIADLDATGLLQARASDVALLKLSYWWP